MPQNRSNRRTLVALIARGIANDVAQVLCDEGHTITSLKLVSESDLIILGLSETQARSLRSESRPPIPASTVIRLLAESASTCCRCQTPGRPIVIHHIEAWHFTHSHEEANLVVVCLNCHADAHTHNNISLELTPDRLRGLKEEWKAQVVSRRAQALAERMDSEGLHSDFINVPRLFELAQLTETAARQHLGFASLRKSGVVDGEGILQDARVWMDRECRFLGDNHHTVALSLYLGSVLRNVVAKLEIVDLSEVWSVSEIRNILRAGQYAVSTGGHYFKAIGPQPVGPGQRRSIVRQGQGIRISGEFDPWNF